MKLRTQKQLLEWIFAIFVIGKISSFLLPVLHHERECSRIAMCRNNLKQISTACALYSMRYNGAYPEELSNLIPDQVSDASLFICRMDPEGEDGMSYVYIPGHTDKSSPDTLVVFDEKGNHYGEGRNVGFLDGHCEWYYEEEFGYVLQDELGPKRRINYSAEGITVLKEAAADMPAKKIPLSWKLRRHGIDWEKCVIILIVIGMVSYYIFLYIRISKDEADEN